MAMSRTFATETIVRDDLCFQNQNMSSRSIAARRVKTYFDKRHYTKER